MNNNFGPNDALNIQNGCLVKFDETKSNSSTVALPQGISIIGERAFKDCTKIRSIILPESLQVIKSEAFAGCAYLENIKFPQNISLLGTRLFKGCNKLKPVNFSSKNISYSFYNGFEILDNSITFFDDSINTEQNLYIPEGISSIGVNAFKDCKKLLVVTIPNSVEAIENGAFMNCSSLCIIDFPDNIMNFGRGIFANCTNLMPIKIANKYTAYFFVNGLELHDKCLTFFDQSINKSTNIIIPPSINTIGQYAFHNCTNIKSVTFPKNLKIIEEGAFANSGLVEVTIPDGMPAIYKHTFYKCMNLENVNIPSTVKNIDITAFEDCPKLKNYRNNINTYYGLQPI